MNNFLAEFAEDYRDALVDYYLGQMVPQHTVPAGRKLATQEDLYEFLLIDHQVNAKVDSSRISTAIASIQQYTHAVLNGMEPGYDGRLDRQIQQQWRQSKSEYAVWAANQMLQDYPENYIEPNLRLKQTSAFRDFINDTNQSRISSDSVQKALQIYLGKFEQISNLQVLTGYIDGTDFRNADYYLIGRQSVEPYGHFWRKVQVRFGAAQGADGGADYLSPTAWSEWLPVEIPKGYEILHIRPLVVEGRLYVCWIEHQTVQKPAAEQRADTPGLYEERSVYSLNMAYRTLDGTWSVPMSFVLKHDQPRGEAPVADAFAAFVSESDPFDKKVVFAYGLESAWDSNCEVLVLDMRFNLLYHGPASPAPSDPYLAKLVKCPRHFSTTARVLQHPLASDEYAAIKASLNQSGEHYKPGFFNARLDLWAGLGVSPQGKYVLLIQGKADVGWHPSLSTRQCTLSLVTHASSPPSPWQVEHDLDRGFLASPFISYELGSAGDQIPDKVVVSFAVEGGNFTSVNQYDIALAPLPEKPPVILGSAQGGQFLDLAALGLNGLRYVRLNTLFAKELVARAAVSVDALLSWDTQHMNEPPLPGTTTKQLMDFHGANGRYFWELFLHIPHAVAWRLHHEFDYLQAEQWLHYLFNPQARLKPTQPPSPFYWSVRPLEEPSRGDYEIEGIADPDAIAYSRPVHYRKAIFTFYVRNLVANGDMLYRRLTRDALAEARLMYSRALTLLGPRPDNRMIGRWEPVALEAAAQPDPALFAGIAAQLPATSALALAPGASPWLDLLDVPRFRLPINTELIDLWDTLDSRLHNLRDNRTLDGKPLLLPLYAPPVDPRALLRAQNGGSGLVQRSVGSLAPIQPYRFRIMLPKIQSAVDLLIRFGDQVRLYHENRSRTKLEELQQTHVWEMAHFSIRLQSIALDQSEAGMKALQATRRSIEQRRDHYARLAEQNVSSTESTVQNMNFSIKSMKMFSKALKSVAAGTGMTAVIVTAVGGGHVKPDSAIEGAAEGVEMVADMLEAASEASLVSEQYRRRREDWIFQRDQAEAELLASDEQIAAQQVTLRHSLAQRDQAIKAEEHAQHHFSYLKTRTANANLYQWLLSQLSTFYFQAYDAVVSLCLSCEACWNYEMGDYKSRFIQPDVWFDTFHGLTAGEALRLQVLRMEAAYLKRFERRQEIVKTVSLKTLFDSQPGTDWATVLKALQEGSTGTLAFELSPRMFDGDYPGHYLRQLINVTVSIPAILGPWQNMRAVLTQVSSRTVLEADKRAMNALYNQPDQDTRNILYNPRASQSICLSSGVDDSGLFQLSYADERYLPFEGTGALSTWELHFPRHGSEQQQAILQNLTDIIVQVRYIALPGGPEFTAHVESLLDS